MSRSLTFLGIDKSFRHSHGFLWKLRRIIQILDMPIAISDDTFVKNHIYVMITEDICH